MEESNSYFSCQNCRKNIPSINRTIHELRCVPIKPTNNNLNNRQRSVIVTPEATVPVAQPISVSASSRTQQRSEPSVPTATAPSAVSRSGWTCERCTYINDNSNSHVCEVCGTSCLQHLDGTDDSMLVDEEELPVIPPEYVHHEMGDENEMIYVPEEEYPLPERNPPTNPSSVNIPADSWQCSRCTLINSLRNNGCTACGELRPAQSSRREQLIDDSFTEPFEFMETYPDMMQQQQQQQYVRRSNVPSSALFGATMGAGLAFVNGGSVTRGAAEGAGMGLLGGVMMDLLNAEMDRAAMRQPIIIQRRFGPSGIGLTPLELFAAQMFANGGNPTPPQGVSEETLHQLPTRVYKASEQGRSSNTSDANDTTCSICLSQFEDGENVKTLPCLHHFHSQCVDRWLNQSNVCPVCKHQIR